MNHLRKLFPALLLACVFVTAARADRLDDYVREQMRRQHVPGLALAVIRGGRVIEARGYGLASVEHNVPVTPETVFEIGSVSKQMTAAAVMLLVEEGKIGLDDPVGKYLPGTPDAWAGVTVRHLLTHTSGIKNYTGLPGFELTERLGRDDFIKLIGAHPLNFPPGAQHSYGNTNYNLLGFIIEAVSARPYWEFVTERIFRPLGMAATGDRDPRRVIPRRAGGYEWEGGELVGRDYDLTDVFSAGAVVSTVLDLAKWNAALDGERLLRRRSLEQIWTPARLAGGAEYPYGLGWYVENFRGRRRLRHNGQTAGFAASIARYPDDRMAFIVLCNLGTIGLAGRINQGVAKLYIPALSLRTLGERPDDDPQTTRLLQTITAERLAGRADAESFAPEARRTLSGESAREYWRQLASRGPLGGFALVEREEAAGRRTLRYRASVGRHLLLLRFALAPDGKIAEMVVEEEE